MSRHQADPAPEQGHRAQAFDIRVFVASLIGLYGIILVLMGLFSSSAQDLEMAADVNINLLAGIGMLLLAAGFLLWARLRPVIVPDHHTESDADTPAAG